MNDNFRIEKIEYWLKTERIRSCGTDQIVSEWISALVQVRPGVFVKVELTPEETEAIRDTFFLKAALRFAEYSPEKEL